MGKIKIPYSKNIPNSWFTRNYGLELDGSCPSEGWGIFRVGDHLEVQKIDNLDILTSDDEAKRLAKKRGIKFLFPDHPFMVGLYRYELLKTKKS